MEEERQRDGATPRATTPSYVRPLWVKRGTVTGGALKRDVAPECFDGALVCIVGQVDVAAGRNSMGMQGGINAEAIYEPNRAGRGLSAVGFDQSADPV